MDFTFLSEDANTRAAIILLCTLIISYLVSLILTKWLPILTRKTKTDLDDVVVQILSRPIFVSILLLGLSWSIGELAPAANVKTVMHSSFKTIAVIVWSISIMGVGTVLLKSLTLHANHLSIFQPRALPLLDIMVKMVIIGAATYFGFLAWDINVTGWLASAGIVGIAVGFAAKDTLANLFAGFFILADAPYKLGDYVILDGGHRGKVTDIGIRSTRILTRDDVEITIPNAVIANSKIVNETGGPTSNERVRVTVYVAYGSDIDKVRKLMLSCAEGAAHVCPEPKPSVKFREFGDSGLKFQLMVWIDQPAHRGRVLDQLNSRVYKIFNREGIEIPYDKHDVYIKGVDIAEPFKAAGLDFSTAQRGPSGSANTAKAHAAPAPEGHDSTPQEESPGTNLEQ